MEISAHTIWNLVRFVSLIAFGIYAGLLIRMFFLQSRMVYNPQRDIEAAPDSIGLPFEDVSFNTDDGEVLHGWFIPVERSCGTVLICHGNGGNISNRLETLALFNRLGMQTFIFDYRGYGKSTGTPDEQGTYLDAETAWKWLVSEKNVVPDELIILGRSLGGAVAAWLGKEHKPKALIIESAFTSVSDLAAGYYPWFPVRLISRFRYATIDYLREVSCPVLIVHSPEDNIVPYEHGRKLFEAVSGHKQFLEITGVHNDGFLISGKLYEDGLNAFLKNNL